MSSCRMCGGKNLYVFLDLGFTPLPINSNEKIK